jgi:hypothetical protein
MKRALRRTSVAALALAALAIGCASEPLVQVRASGAGAGQTLAVKRVAIAPFRAAPRPGAGALRADATGLVAGYVGDAFATRGLDVVPTSDVAQALGAGAETDEARSIIQIAGERFGADAVVVGTVYRFRERSGEALGSTRPASVGFDVKLFATASGKLLWAGTFDHTQVALSENALVAARYPGGGTRWMTAEELARWGASELARALPLE